MKRLLLALLLLAVPLAAEESVGGSFIRYYPPAGGLTSPVTTPDPLNFSGVTNFTSTVKVYQTATHTGTAWISFSNNGSSALVTSGVGYLDLGTAGSIAIRVLERADFSTSAFTVPYNTFSQWGYGTGQETVIGFQYTGQTPLGQFVLGTGAAQNSIHIIESGDRGAGFDFTNGPCGSSVCVNPTLVIHDATQSTTKWIGLASDGTSAVVSSGTEGVRVTNANGTISQVFPAKTLTELATNPTLFTMANATNTVCAGSVEYTVTALVSTPNFQSRHGAISFIFGNNAGAGGNTNVLGAASETADGSVVLASTGTLTYTLTAQNGAGNKASSFSLLPTSSLTQDSIKAEYRVNLDPASASSCTLNNNDALQALVVDYWKMDEAANTNRRTSVPVAGAGTDLTDLDTNHGQGTGFLYQKATDFAGGADGAFELLNAGAVGHLVGKTACLWFKETADANSNLFTMGEGITDQDEEWELTYIASGDNLAFAGFADHADGNASQAIVTATTNTWHLACMALNDTTHKAQLSVDGAAFSFGSVMGGDPAFNQDATADLVVGSYPVNFASKFTGQVGPIIKFSSILTDAQAALVYAAGNGAALY